jgi:hypothetical protein
MNHKNEGSDPICGMGTMAIIIMSTTERRKEESNK